MEGTIKNYRRGRHRQTCNQAVVVVDGVDSKDKAGKLVGKEAVWTSPAKKEIKGKIASAHGNSGAVRVVFEKGIPGQAISSKIQIK